MALSSGEKEVESILGEGYGLIGTAGGGWCPAL
jgi:hypothetical protein